MDDWGRVRKVALATARAQGMRDDEAQDVAGEVTLALMRGNTDPSLWQDFERYVRSATHHEVVRQQATKRRRDARETRQAREIASKAPGPEELAELLGEMAAAVECLDESERSLIAYVALGMTSKQIGRVLGIKPEAARKRLQRVREVIRVRVVRSDD